MEYCFEISKNFSRAFDRATCISLLYSAVLKLSRRAQKSTVYRGVNKTRKALPKSFYEADDDSFAAGVELGFMSTSEDIN